MEYSIHQLSKLSGVSSRALRYYDEIGLLNPVRINDAGYRFYSSKEVDLLQQILFYRERGLSLEKIRSILYDPNFDKLNALQEHLDSLEKQQRKIQDFIQTVKVTMKSMKGEIIMSDKEKFDVFKQNMIKEYEMEYGEEAREKYGEEEVISSIKKISDMSWEDYKYFEELGKEILEDLKEAVITNIQPESEMGRHIALLHKNWLACTWKEYTKQAHKGIIMMYLEDDRFRNYYDKEQKGCAKFLSDAVSYWLDKEGE